MLRSGFAARLARRPDLLLRVHVLPRVRRRSARRSLSQLHRRTGAPADTAERPAAAPSGVDAPHLSAGRMCPDVTLRASRRGSVPPFIAMDVLRAANERVISGAVDSHLEVGQPGTSAPEAVLEAARRALAGERIGYTQALGLAPFRPANA